MRAQDMILVSVDDHLVEPPTLFDAHIPERYRDRAPKVITTRDGSDIWTFEGSKIPNIGLNAVAGRPKTEYGIEPTAFDEIRPGCWNIDERIKDMNAGGVLGSMNFPSFPGFSGRLFAAVDDKDLALAVVHRRHRSVRLGDPEVDRCREHPLRILVGHPTPPISSWFRKWFPEWCPKCLFRISNYSSLKDNEPRRTDPRQRR